MKRIKLKYYIINLSGFILMFTIFELQYQKFQGQINFQNCGDENSNLVLLCTGFNFRTCNFFWAVI